MPKQSLQQVSRQQPQPSLLHLVGQKRLQRERLKLTIKALALTASFVLFASWYVAGYARIARNEYQRQRLLREIRRLRARNAELRQRIDSLRAHNRVTSLAMSEGMRLADPLREVDFVALGHAGKGKEGTAKPTAWALRQKERMATAFSSAFSRLWASPGSPLDVAEASALGPMVRSRKGPMAVKGGPRKRDR